MAVQNRIERYSKIRAGLDYPYSQKPNPSQILNAMLMQEQAMLLKISNISLPVSLISKTLATVSGTNTYTIEQPVSSYQNSGKPYFVVRATGNADTPYLPVPFNDFSEQEYGKLPSGQVNAALSVPESISFYRTSGQNQVITAVIQPTPQEILSYTIWFFTGEVDRAQTLMTGQGPMTELSDYMDLKAMFALLPVSEWRDDDDFNRQRRTELGVGIGLQVAELQPTVDMYMKTLLEPETFEMGHWNG